MRSRNEKIDRALESIVMLAELLEDATLEDGVLTALASVGSHPDEEAEVEFTGGWDPHDLPRKGQTWLTLAPRGSMLERYAVFRVGAREEGAWGDVTDDASTWAPEPGRSVRVISRGESGANGGALELGSGGLARILSGTGAGLVVGEDGRVSLSAVGGLEVLAALESLAVALASTCKNLALATVVVAGAPVPLSNAPVFATQAVELETLITLIRAGKR